MNYIEMLKRVQFRCDQKPLIGEGVVIHKTYDGEEYKIGDMVDIDGRVGILVLILDQGICLLSEKYWMQINSDMYKKSKWEKVYDRF